MELALDTNAISAVADGVPAAVERFSEAQRIVVPVVVLGEYRYGIRRSRKRQEYERWLDRLIGSTRVLEVGIDTTRHYADVRLELTSAGHPIPTNDVWVAALCREFGVALMTRDQHFAFVPALQIVTW